MSTPNTIPRLYSPFRTLWCLLLLAAAAQADRAYAAALQEVQASDTTTEQIQVFLDCNAHNCDFDHFRREIPWVNWVRDRQDGSLHLLVTAERTGGGGWRYTLDFLGRNEFAGATKSRVYVSDPTDTDAEVRQGLTQTIAVGLVQFVEAGPVGRQLRIVYDQEELPPITMAEEQDPWNLWVFRIGVEGSIDGEAQERGYSLEGNVNADRVAEDFKINIRIDAEYDREEFDELDQGETFVNTSGDYSADLLMVWSLSDRWSLGGRSSVSRSTFLNQDIAAFAGPALEFNLFPYKESTRRAITFRYSFEVAALNYELRTVEGRTYEVLPLHTLEIAAAVQQPWGEVFGSIEGIQYLNDPATHRINTFLNVEYRLFRGFNLDLFASFSRIKDQFYLPAEDLTPAEILVRRRQRETDYRFDIGLGISYRFGSKFANIVNPRMSRTRRR